MGWRQAANPFVIARVRAVRPTSAQSLPLAIPFERSAFADPSASASPRPDTALALPLLPTLGAMLLQRARVRVEHLLMLRRECRANLPAFALHQRLQLLPIACRLLPRRLHRRGVPLLS